jgi:hypothetical protein
LPKCIRDELGHRIEDGEPGKELVKWLNGLSGVQRVLKEQFGGRAVTEQNLSEWKQGGHQKWLRHWEACEKMRWLAERAEGLDDAADGLEISDRLGSILAAELADAAQKLDEIADPQERWRRLQEILRELWRLRSEDHNGKRLQLNRARWEREVERQDEEDLKREEKAHKNRLIGMCFSQMQQQTMAECLGGGESGKKMAELLHRIRYDLPLDDLVDAKLSGKTCPASAKPDPTESDPIQPNPTKYCGATPERTDL